MLWRKILSYHKIGFGTFLLVFVSVLFCSFFLDTRNSFAVSDLVYVQSTTSTHYLCGGSSGVNCSDYSYLLVENTGPTTGFTSCSGPVLNSASYLGLGNFPFISLRIDSSLSSIRITGVQCMSNVSSFEFTYTLTDSFGSVPSGSLSISQNGTYDVTQYAEAVVDVPAQVIQGDYHDDLVNIYHAIIICAAVWLVLYFFYCIYRMIIKSTGGWS